jgi:hypothetical protein
MNKTPFRLVTITLFVFLLGCGTDEYQSRLDRKLSGLSSGSKFSVLGGDTPIPDSPFSIRLPTTMQSVDIKDAQRGKFSVFELESVKATYEGTIKDSGGGKLPYYLYVSVSDMGNSTQLPLMVWLNALQTKLLNSPDSSSEPNKNYSASTAEGGDVQWEEIHYHCPQKFLYTNNEGKQVYQDMKGTLVMISRAENGKAISLIFRYPSDLESQHGPEFDSDWIKLIAGTLKVEASAQ